jgi:hypothetical protein
MSMAARRAAQHSILCVTLSVLALAALSCEGSTQADDPDTGLSPAFLTPVAAAEDSGLRVYWLGESVEVQGMVFRAVAADVEEQHDPSPLEIFYSAEWADGGSVGFTLASSRGASYEEAVERQLSRPGRATRRDAKVAGWPATLIERTYGGVVYHAIIVEAPDSVVLAIANPTIASGGTQVNPLYDPTQLVVVLQNLRPYPE